MAPGDMLNAKHLHQHPSRLLPYFTLYGQERITSHLPSNKAHTGLFLFVHSRRREYYRNDSSDKRPARSPATCAAAIQVTREKISSCMPCASTEKWEMLGGGCGLTLFILKTPVTRGNKTKWTSVKENQQMGKKAKTSDRCSALGAASLAKFYIQSCKNIFLDGGGGGGIRRIPHSFTSGLTLLEGERKNRRVTLMQFANAWQLS